MLSSCFPIYDWQFFGFSFPFVDDGSSSCCCWADAERAATLLRLHEKHPRAFASNDWTLNGTEKENSACSTNISRLERILKNYNRITVKNYGSLFDSSYQDLAVSVSSDNALSSSDERFVKSLVFNACFGTQQVSSFYNRESHYEEECRNSDSRI